MGCRPSKSSSATMEQEQPKEQPSTSADNTDKKELKNDVIDFIEDLIEDLEFPPTPSKLSKKDLIKNLEDFAIVDENAKKAPAGLRNCLPDLVYYLKTPSKDPLYVVRSFFVWIANNIKYDTDGYFGKGEKSSCEAGSVLLTGKSVCDGYANVMVEMCKLAEIPVKKLSGFSKGYSHSPDNPFTAETKTNHAWNAVFIRDNWFLLDSTWGAGTIKDKEFKPGFQEFYFLTDPEEFAYSHFPYEDGNLEESLKWQLQKHPLSLEKFNRMLNIEPAAFEIGFLPESNKNSIVRFNDEVELTFKDDGHEDTDISAKLFRKEENTLIEEMYSCYGYRSNGLVKFKVKPQQGGHYRLRVYGGKRSTDTTDSMTILFQYILNSTVPAGDPETRKYLFPFTFNQALTDDCQVLDPLGKQILAGSEVEMRFQSPHLQRIAINQQLLERDGDVFFGKIKAPDSGCVIKVFGSRSDKGSLDAVYKFHVV